MIIAACALLAVSAVALVLWHRVCWVGHRELQVIVRIADADSLKPLSNVPVVVFTGPSANERVLPSLSRDDLRPRPDAADTQRFTTDDDGQIRFTRRFFAAGEKGLFSHSGYVRLAGSWLRIAPPDYGTVLIPLGEESLRPRSIDDDSPVFVTLFFKRPGSKN